MKSHMLVTNFVYWLRYCTDVAQRRSTKLCTMFGRFLRWYTIYTFFWGELLPPNGILPPAKFTLCQSLAFSYIGSVTAWHSISGASESLRRGTRNGITELSQRAPHIYSAKRPSRWASAYILVYYRLSFFVFLDHIARTTYVDAVYCYWPSSVVCRSVCHTTDPCENGWTDRFTVLVCGLGWAEGSTSSIIFARWCQCAHTGWHIWRHLANTIEPPVWGGSARSYFKFLWPLVFIVLFFRVVVMAALWNRGPLYFCPVVTIFLSFFLSIFFSSPNLSGRR